MSWGARKSNLPLLAWSSRWADLPWETRGSNQGQRPDLLESLADVCIVIQHLSFPGFSLGALGASWSLFSSRSRFPLVSPLSWGAGLAIDTSFSLWPRGPREPWRAGLPSASSDGVARIALLSLLPQEAEQPGGACSPLLALGSWCSWLTLHPSHRDSRRPLCSLFARHPWHAPFSLPAVVALDPWVSLWSRRPKKARWPHGSWKSWAPQRSTWSRGAWWPRWALDAGLALFTLEGPPFYDWGWSQSH